MTTDTDAADTVLGVALEVAGEAAVAVVEVAADVASGVLEVAGEIVGGIVSAIDL